MGFGHDLVHGHDGAQGVGHVGDRHKTCRRTQERTESLHVQLTRIADGRDLESGPGLLTHELPRNDVRMVFQGGDHDLVTGPQQGTCPGLGHQVDALGGSSGEHHLTVFAGVEEARHPRASALIRIGRPFAQRVHAAMHVCVVVLVVVTHRVDDGAGLLGRGAVVQVHQWVSVYVLMQDREVCANGVDVEEVVTGAGPARDG